MPSWLSNVRRKATEDWLTCQIEWSGNQMCDQGGGCGRGRIGVQHLCFLIIYKKGKHNVVVEDEVERDSLGCVLNTGAFKKG